jgi:hypothetical protein
MPEPEEPPPPPERIPDDEALRLLREFLRQLEKLLSEVVKNPGLASPGRHGEKMSHAWDSVRLEFVAARRALNPKVGKFISPLSDAGLTGPQLVFKLSIFNHAYDELMDVGIPKEDAPPKKQRWWRRLFKPVLSAADVILGSLAKVGIPGAEVIQEFKEAVESGTELIDAVRGK